MENPYYAVIFTSLKTNQTEGYDQMVESMETLAKQQPGYLSIETVQNELEITISYWDSLDAIKNWKANLEHLIAQKLGKEQWYRWYKVRICKVEREYTFGSI